MRTLSEVMAYRNDEVVLKFQESFPISRGEADAIFEELKKFLWMAARSKKSGHKGVAQRTPITDSMILLDEMWHCFILFTREYEAFCKSYLGGFVHHAPTPHQEKMHIRQAIAASPEKPAKMQRSVIKQSAELVCEHLGPDTARKWFIEWDQTYPVEGLRQIWRSPLS